jgi:hypothetical protein
MEKERETRDIVEINYTLNEIYNDLVYWLNEGVVVSSVNSEVKTCEQIISVLKEFRTKY